MSALHVTTANGLHANWLRRQWHQELEWNVCITRSAIHHHERCILLPLDLQTEPARRAKTISDASLAKIAREERLEFKKKKIQKTIDMTNARIELSDTPSKMWVAPLTPIRYHRLFSRVH